MHYTILSTLKLGILFLLKCFYFSIHYDIHQCTCAYTQCKHAWHVVGGPTFIMIAQSHLRGILRPNKKISITLQDSDHPLHLHSDHPFFQKADIEIVPVVVLCTSKHALASPFGYLSQTEVEASGVMW